MTTIKEMPLNTYLELCTYIPKINFRKKTLYKCLLNNIGAQKTKRYNKTHCWRCDSNIFLKDKVNESRLNF